MLPRAGFLQASTDRAAANLSPRLINRLHLAAMKASCDTPLKVLRCGGLLATALLLCQCAMPPRQAWHYIQNNGLLTYWSYSASRPSPPFSPGSVRSQRYVAARSNYAAPRYTDRPASSWSSYWGGPIAGPSPHRGPIAAPRSQSRYFTEPVRPAPRPERPAVVETRPTPPPRPRPTPPRSDPPATRMPVDEPRPIPAAPPMVRNEPPPTVPTPAPEPMPSITARSNGNGAAGVKPAGNDLPFGTPVPGRVNMVNSPYAGRTQLVDVSGMGPGQTVKCPYTGKLFKVPPTQQASNETQSKSEGSESKGDDKKP